MSATKAMFPSVRALSRRASLTTAGLVLVFVGAVALRVADPLPIKALREFVFDSFERWSPREYRDAGVRVVDIDDQSLERIGQWPWPRSMVAALIDRLGAAGAAAIGVDVVFAEPDRSPPTMTDAWRDNDTILAQAIHRTPTALGIVLGPRTTAHPTPAWGLATEGADVGPRLDAFAGAIQNLPVLQNAASGFGVLNFVPDHDGVVRTMPLLFRVGGDFYPSLPLELLRVAERASTYVIKGSGASGFSALGEDAGMNGLLVGKREVPTDANARVTFYDTGYEPQRTIPAWQILDGSLGPDALAGKIVLIGASAGGLNDRVATPSRPLVTGTEVDAQILEQMLLGTMLRRPNWMTGAELIWLATLCGLLMLFLARVGPVLAAALGGATVALSAVVSWVAFRRLGLLFDPVYPALGAAALYLAQSRLFFLRTDKDRRQLKNAFEHYLPPQLLGAMAKDASLLRLGGEVRDMSILFCDIRGFTSRAETMDAQALTHFANGFFTPMTERVMARGGTVDKYIGDCLMAFWNAPLPEPRHAEYAVRAALDISTTLVGLNARWRADAMRTGGTFAPVAVGIGIASGPCCVGNIGSERRFNYSVLGDDVNLASRLESQTKVYGVPIIVSEATQATIRHFAALELDLLRVKGKSQPHRIFAVLGDEAAAAEPWFVPLAERHRAMLADFRAGNFMAVRQHLLRLRVTAPETLRVLYRLYEERIERFGTAAPAADWDGVMVAETK
ncbi:MAG TPA: adenylate/guanylate cyclase domain-containing protein [Stellaceae bacterium]|nr:adenylate/guanylate cyclase domain-containing protein [Stellaceae bacterium]